MSFGVALHIMLALARNDGRRLNSTQLAASVRANPVTVRRVVGHLVTAGLVETQTGPGGGATLARAPAQISVDEIHEAIGSPSWIEGHDNPPNPKCDVSVCMPRVIHRLNRAIDERANAVMKRTTLKKLLDEEVAEI